MALGFAARFVGSLFPSMGGLTLGTYAVMFAGVHFVARNHGRFLEDLIGGILAGVIAASCLLLLTLVGVDIVGEGGGLVNVLIRGILIGAAGALGMVLIKHIRS